ncbi:MAG: hypothetical protein O3B87_02530 [bacterium]|nr:hypothetical protein [bacterium]
MKDLKSIILIIVILVLVGAAAYLTYIIQDGSNPLVLLNSQASAGDANDPLLAANLTPTPTITFQSTSPTPSLDAGVTVTITTTASPTPTSLLSSPTPTITKLPETGGGAIIVTATPTPIQQLPVAGFSDWIGYMSVGGGALILLALLL